MNATLRCVSRESASIEAANAWLDTFIADFNRRFARAATYPKDLHRPVAESNEELDDIFAWQEQRKLSKTLTFRYDKMIYLFEPTEENTRIAGEKITAYDYPDGTLAFIKRLPDQGLNLIRDGLPSDVIDDPASVNDSRSSSVCRWCRKKNSLARPTADSPCDMSVLQSAVHCPDVFSLHCHVLIYLFVCLFVCWLVYV